MPTDLVTIARRLAQDTLAHPSVLDSALPTAPAWARAVACGVAASTVGFDWPRADDVFLAVRAELDELGEALHEPTAALDELGDVLFSLAQLARHLHLDPEAALAQATRKFETRFRLAEASLVAMGTPMATADHATREEAWAAAKEASR